MISGFNKQAAGAFMQADSSIPAYKMDGDLFRGVSVAASSSGKSFHSVCLTGYYIQAPRSGAIMFQTTGDQFIDIEDGWTATGYDSKTPAQAQDYVNKMIANNKVILENNLLCARFAYKLNASQKKTLYELQTRLQERNQQLLTDGLVEQPRSSEAYGYSYLNQSLVSFMQTGGVGLVVSTTVAIVVGCVVVASLSTAAYFAYKALYNESERDIKYSKELTAVLKDKLTEEEYQQLLSETAGILTREKIASKFSGAYDFVKIGLIAAGAYFVYKFISNSKQG